MAALKDLKMYLCVVLGILIYFFYNLPQRSDNMENPISDEKQVKIRNKLNNNVNEDYTSSDVTPQINLKEPEPHDPLLIWAEKNIGENPNVKLALIEEFRDMIFERGECEPHRTDDAFLIRFLRARHFIVRMAHRLMVNYYTFREENPNYFFKVDYNKIMDIGEADVLNVPPYTDQNDRRMLFIRFGKWNPAQFTTDEFFQAVIFLIQTAILEPKHQILGGVCILDVGDIGTSQAWYLTPTIAKHILAVAYSSLPHRIHAVHIINISRIFDYAFSMLKPFLSEIMKERIFIHQDLESLHKHIPQKYLPKRYGGTQKDYRYHDWLNILKENDVVIDELESYGYDGGREFLKKL